MLNTKQIDCTRRIHRFYQYIMLYYIKHIQPYCRRHCIRPGKSLMSVRLTGDLSEVKHSDKLTKGVLKNESVSSSLFRDTGSSGTLYKSCGCSGHHTAQPKSRDLFSGGRAWSEIK